jgi:hypothetical protein
MPAGKKASTAIALVLTAPDLPLQTLGFPHFLAVVWKFRRMVPALNALNALKSSYLHKSLSRACILLMRGIIVEI